MSDEQERAEPPASEETPSQPPAEPPAEQPHPEGAAPPAAQGAPEGAESPAAPPAEEKPAEAQAAAEPAAPPQAPPPAEEKPPEPPATAAAANFDGLESGLSWFGFERFEPPSPVGYEAPPEAPPAPARELSEEDLDRRRRRIQGRFEARRKEVETQKAWHQKIPMGALSMAPILVVLIIVAIFYPPWGGGNALPSAKEALDEALLSAQPLPNPDVALRQLGVQEAAPRCWSVLPGTVVAMASKQDSAKLAFALPEKLSRFEVACDICVVDRDEGSWGASLTVEGAVGITLQAHPEKEGKGYVAGRRAGNTMGGYPHDIKPRMWDEVKVIIDSTAARYAFNGKELTATAPRPAYIAKVELTTYNTRLMIRNWRITPLE